MSMSEVIAQGLLEVGAVSLSVDAPYTWASGIISPIYCDNRVTLAYPELRHQITLALVELIRRDYPGVEVIAGTATAGIAQAALVARVMGLPMAYVRAKAKDHGKQNQIEGRVEAGQKVVVIEDLISTGGSCIEACKALSEHGAVVLGVCANFSYLLEAATTAFAAAGFSCVTITDYDVLTGLALQKGMITENQLDSLKQWRLAPQAWGK